MSKNDELNRRIQELRTESERDWLTGVYNREASRKRIEELIANCGGVLIILDIENFKKVNERYGHLAGDRALQQLVEVVGHMVLRNDLIGRIDGDRFVIFIRGERNDSFVEERIRQICDRVASMEISDIGAGSIRLNCGWTRSKPSDRFEDVFTRAEENLNSNLSAENGLCDKSFGRSIKTDGRKISSALKESGAVRGAFYQEYEEFAVLYRYIERVIKRSGSSAFILLLTLIEEDGGMLRYEGRTEIMETLGECIRTALRVSDVYTQYSSTQYLIMNVDTDMRYTETIANRVRKAFYEKIGPNSKNLLLYESYPMGITESVDKTGV